MTVIWIAALLVNDTIIQQPRKYAEAKSLMNDQHYLQAYAIFEKIRGYKDVDELIKQDKNLKDLDGQLVKDGEITFGRYEQDGDTANGTEKIKWIILEKEDNRALLLSKYGLDVKPYNEERGISNSWEESEIRRWLNNEFINTAFTDAERLEILDTDVDNSLAEGRFTIYSGGNTTKDKVFLLSYKEAFKDYFTDDTELICMPTPYAVQQGELTRADNGACL